MKSFLYEFVAIILILYCSKKKSTQLSVVTVQSTSIAPKENVTYTKQTQTVTSTGHERDGKYKAICNAFYNSKSRYNGCSSFAFSYFLRRQLFRFSLHYLHYFNKVHTVQYTIQEWKISWLEVTQAERHQHFLFLNSLI